MYNFGSSSTCPRLGSREQNHNIYKRTLMGTSIEDSGIPEATAARERNPFIAFQDTRLGKRFGMALDTLALGLLIIGSAGSGKTNFLFMIILRLIQIMRRSDKLVMFDTKGDEFQEFGRRIPADNCYLIGTGEEYADITRYHNIFGELMDKDAEGNYIYTEESDVDALELANVFFEEMQSELQPVFPAMSAQVIASVMIYFMRKYARTQPELLNNREFLSFFMKTTNEEFKKIYEEPFMADQRKCLDYIKNEKGNQTQGVNSYIGSALRKIFIGPFAKADPSREFSIREIMKSDKKAVVFVEYDLKRGQVLGPMYKILLDQALKYGLGGRQTERDNLYMVIDEWPRLPKLTHMDDSLGMGRSQGVKVICGCQNVSAIIDKYGEAGADSILSAFQNIVAFKLNDGKSRDFVRNQMGENYQNISFSAQNDSCNIQREGHTVEDWHLRKLRKGEAVVSLVDADPFFFRFPKY